MKTTIDKAGRVVIPAGVRQRAGFTPGTTLDVEFREGEVTLRRDVPPPRLIRQGKRLIAKPQVQDGVGVTISEWIEAERDRWPL